MSKNAKNETEKTKNSSSSSENTIEHSIGVLDVEDILTETEAREFSSIHLDDNLLAAGREDNGTYFTDTFFALAAIQETKENVLFASNCQLSLCLERQRELLTRKGARLLMTRKAIYVNDIVLEFPEQLEKSGKSSKSSKNSSNEDHVSFFCHQLTLENYLYPSEGGTFSS